MSIELERFFRQVDPIREPAELLSTLPGVVDSFTLEDGRRASIAKQIRLRFESAIGYDYGEARSLTKYEEVFGLRAGGFEALLRQHAARVGKRKLSVFDCGCDKARAFSEILVLDLVDRENSVGITIDGFDELDPIAAANVLRENILNIGAWHKFDVVISAFGGLSSFHPLGHIFGLLHGIAFLNIGGLIFIEKASSRKGTFGSRDIKDLIKIGVLETLEDFLDIVRNAEMLPSGFRLKACPTSQQIHKLLDIGPSKVFY